MEYAPLGLFTERVGGERVEERLGLPVREFLYTLDQICFLLGIGVIYVNKYVYFPDSGSVQTLRDEDQQKMRAVLISPTEFHDAPEWRVTEGEFLKYMRQRGVVIYEHKFR